MGNWSSGMIPASGAGGPEFDSRITPLLDFAYHELVAHASLGLARVKTTGLEKMTECLPITFRMLVLTF